MLTKKVAVGASAAVVFALALAGCSSDSGSAETGSTGSTGAASAPAAASSASAAGSPDAAASSAGVDWQAEAAALFDGVGFEPPSPGAPPVEKGKKVWWISAGLGTDAPAEAAQAMKDIGAKLGWDVTVFDGKFQTNVMLNGIDQAIAAKADGMIFWVVDCAGVQSGLEKAKEAGIPTVNIEGEECSPNLFSHTVRFGAAPGRDPEEQFVAWGETMATQAIAATNAQTKVILITETDLLNTRATAEGWKQALAKCPTCEIVDEVEFVAADFGPTLQNRIEQSILKHPDANAILPAYDAVMTAGGSAAVLSSGRQADLYVMGGEGSAPGMDQIRNGTGMQACSGLDPSYEVYAGADALIWLFGGKDPSATSNGEGFQLCDKDRNMPASGSYKASYPFQDYYYKYWGVSE